MPPPNIYIVGAKRTPFGAFCGKLKNHSATDLAALTIQAALKSASVTPEQVDHVIFGNVLQSSRDAPYITRHAALRAGIPQSRPALTVNRLCGSGFQSVAEAMQQILVGDTKIAVAGGSESMTQVPFVVRGARFGFPLGTATEYEDYLWNLGEMYRIQRDECDEYAHRSQTLYRLAKNAGYFEAEIEPVPIKSKKGEETFDADEHPRETTVEGLAKLGSVFKKNGLVTAGNASGVCDGAAAVVVADESSVDKLHLQPLVRVVGYHVVGCDPTIMGIGPVEAIRGLCKKTGVSLDSVELIEVNEAFAAQVLAVQKELQIDSDRLNVNGGALAVGHPLGTSGARITGHLAHEIKRRGIRYAIGSACIGGGQGIAILLEKV